MKTINLLSQNIAHIPNLLEQYTYTTTTTALLPNINNPYVYTCDPADFTRINGCNPYPNWVDTFPASLTYVTDTFRCYATSETFITQKRRELIFHLLERTQMDYDGMIKHLAMEEKLFNTLLLEFSIKYRPTYYMQLVATTPSYSKYDLYTQVVKKIN